MDQMKYYFAPLEGITWYVYRNAHNRFFPGMTKYFAPFIVASYKDEFSTRERIDLMPEHNLGIHLVPQVLTNSADAFLYTLNRLKEFDYQEVNINLGCPSRTVVSKFRGAGFLAKPEELDRFLDGVFMKTTLDISVKTRIGKEDPAEFERLLEIYNKYPLKELIIHPRLQTDFYKNTPNMDVFRDAVNISTNPVCYNGDLLTSEDLDGFRGEFPQLDSLMIGRGLIANPGMVHSYSSGEEIDYQKIKEFHDTLYAEYRSILFGDKNVLYRMKELWSYMISLFDEDQKSLKKIHKTNFCSEYEVIVESIFRERKLDKS